MASPASAGVAGAADGAVGAVAAKVARSRRRRRWPKAEVNYNTSFADDYSGEIDTTPRLDDPRPTSYVRPADIIASTPDEEVDTTPQPIERAAPPQATASERAAPPPRARSRG